MNSTFRFTGSKISLDTGIATFTYEIEQNSEHFTFTETLHFPTENKIEPNSQLLKIVLDNLHLMLGISYFKLFCPTTIETPNIALTEEQAAFWNTVYTKGLGEFFYKNNINYINLIHFPFTKDATVQTFSQNTANRSLLFFGGGKDSVVSAELLKKANKPFTTLMINNSQVQEQSATLVGAERIIIKREIDKQIFDLNKRKDVYNGHVPATAIWDFIGLLAAIMYDYKYIIGSNEHSANYGNVAYLGEEINHQWSKSFEFETLFQNYVKKFMTPSVIYFSLLRPFNEIKIVEIFSKYPQYFPYFSSCNKNFAIINPQTNTRWCCACPKCLFVFITLAAFLPKQEIIKIFGKNLLADSTLLELLQELLGIKNIKPFECVGTPQEVQYALLKIHKTGEYKEDALVQYAEKEILPKLNEEVLKNIVLIKDTQHAIPSEFKEIV